MKFSKKAFTLVELIVIMLVLAILSTIAFLSFMGYSRDARDAVRLSDITSIDKSLELFKTKTQIYPEPSNSTDITYLWWLAWKQWTMWESVVNNLEELDKIMLDPLVWSEYSYSRLNTADEYQIATAYEGDIIWYNSFFNEVVAEWEKEATAYVTWNYNWQIITINTWSLIYVAASPSIISSDLEVTDVKEVIDQKKLVYTWFKNLPDAYKWTDLKVDWWYDFKIANPIVFTWTIDDFYEDERKRINLVRRLQIAFWDKQFEKDSTHTELLTKSLWTEEWKEFVDEFLWTRFHKKRKVRRSFIFPIDCWDETGTFEWFSSWALISESCLFSSEWSTEWIVEEWTGSWWTKWASPVNLPNSSTSTFVYYPVFNKPARLSFDYNIQMSVDNKVEFYINWIKYEKWSASTSWYNHYETELLPAWDYKFEWRVTRNWANSHQIDFWIDNILVDCIWWWAWCWWTLWFEDGDIPPFDMLTFWWWVKSTWKRVTDSSQWLYSIKSPLPPASWNAIVEFKKRSDEPFKFSFDHKVDMNSWNTITFYINWERYDKWDYNTLWNNFTTYTTALLPPWDYTFKWVVSRNWNWWEWGHYIYYYFDNFRFECVWWWAWCWWDLWLEDWDVNPWDMFSFTWDAKTPWKRTTDSNQWTYAIASPLPHTSSSNYLTYNYSSAQPFKFNFDHKIDMNSWNSVTFYINWQEYKLWDNSNKPTSYTSVTTPLLPAWDYEFKWKVYRNWNWWERWHFIRYYLDNLRVTCEWAPVWCWWEDLSLDLWSTIPTDIFDFTWVSQFAWDQDSNTKSEWTHSIVSPYYDWDYYKKANLIRTETFTTPQKMSFDIKTSISNAWSQNISFYINGVRYYIWTYSSSTNDWFVTYITPLLPAWTYEFKWEINKYEHYTNQMWLDNIQFTCVWWWWTCWWNDLTMDSWSSNPWDIYSFTWELPVVWNQSSTTKSEWTHSIVSPYYDWDYYKKANLIRSETFATPQKMSFDIKTNISNNWSQNIRFYINGVRYYTWNHSSSTNNWFVTYTTPLLPAWTYDFKWEINKYETYTNQMWLDNIQFTCLWWWWTCWWNNLTLDNWATNPWDIYSFTWEIPVVWDQDSNTKSEGTHSIVSPYYDWDYYKKANLIRTETFTTPQKMSFDIKTSISNAWSQNISFYINGVRYYIWTYSSSTNDWFVTYITPLLPAWTYEFKWEINKYEHYTNQMWLDNIQFTCVWWWWTCWWNDLTMDSWSSNPWDIYSFTWELPVVWNQSSTTKSEWTHSIVSPYYDWDYYKKANLIRSETFATPQKMSFDIKTNISNNWSQNIRFYINGVRYYTWNHSSSTNNWFVTYTTPLLPAWTYDFKWEINKYETYTNQMWLDNIQFTP